MNAASIGFLSLVGVLLGVFSILYLQVLKIVNRKYGTK